MLNLYFGRESIDKEKFIFDHIKGKTLLLVPDQFTLEAEQRAFSVLGVKGLMELEIISPSRLGFRVLAKVGGNKLVHIDKYGRHMLLTKIIGGEKDKLQAFKGLEARPSFVEMMNNLISEMKQYNTTPSQLAEITAGVTDNLLQKKLLDIQRIYEKYEDAVCDKYVDTEDYTNLFLSKLKDYEEIRDREIWVWGFDYFTPKNMDLLRELTRQALSVNIVMTYDEGCRDQEVFRITGNMLNKLDQMGLEENWTFRKEKIGDSYKKNGGWRHQALAEIETELFSIPSRVSDETEGVVLVKAANIYAETETGAAHIVELIRDRGLRFRDIAVICNDMEVRGSVIKRVFEEYGLPVFMDKKRSILHNPIVEYIAALIDIPGKGWQSQDLFRLAKTGLSDLSNGEVEELENYAIQYKIRGNRWKKKFEKGESEIKEGGLARINELRERLTGPISLFEDAYKKSATVSEKIHAVYQYLDAQIRMRDKLEALIDAQIENNLQELADETGQVWGIVVNIFEQLIELIGAEKISAREFAGILSSGFETIEVGLLPPTLDRIMVGTMQRTRASGVKALLIIGANDGVLPAESVTEGLLSEDEKEKLYDNNIEICKIDQLRIREERLAIYKTLSMPETSLWMSHSISDIEGKEMKPSLIFEQMCRIFEKIPVQKDIVSRQDPLELIGAKNNAVRHMTTALRNGLEGQEIDEKWGQVADWYRSNEPKTLEMIVQGIFYTGKLENLGKQVLDQLYRREVENALKLSPSSIEKYGRCPFAFLMSYGLRPDERRLYEIGGREIGDVYHNCLMRMSQELSKGEGEITREDSLWMTVKQEECASMIDRLVEEESGHYKEGLMQQGAAELYKKDRIKKVCGQVAWILVEHVRLGTVKRVAFEAEFGNGLDKIFPAIQVGVGDETVLIEGKIDRVDVLKNNQVKIIDYKSGKEKFDLQEVKAGYRLQLMLYLKAVQESIDKNSVGGGVFYFQIDEPVVDASLMEKSKEAEKIESETLKSYRLDGIMLDDPEVIRNVAGAFEGYSNVFSIRATKEGIKGTSPGKLLSAEEFGDLRRGVDEKLEELCGEILKGNIHPKPKKIKNVKACDYCQFKSVCGFDLAFDGCQYDVID